MIDDDVTQHLQAIFMQARNAPASNIPKFDFALSVVTPQSESAKLSASTAQQAALETSTADLPKFDFGHGFSTAANVAPSSTKSSFPQASLSQPKPATPSSGFSFVATPTTASEAASSSSTSQSEPVTAPSVIRSGSVGSLPRSLPGAFR